MTTPIPVFVKEPLASKYDLKYQEYPEEIKLHSESEQ